MILMRQIYAAIVETVRTHRAPRRYAEPVRVVANKLLGMTAALTAVLTWATTHVGSVPSDYQGTARDLIMVFGAVVMIVTKVATEIIRSKVFSPASFDAAQQIAVSTALAQSPEGNAK